MKKTKVFLKILILSLILISMNLSLSPYKSPAYTQNSIPVLRLSGSDRYHTAVAVSREGWKTSEYVVLTTGDGDDKFADALAGSPIAYALNAPILLTNTDKLNHTTKEEIIRLNAKNIILLGGTGVISDCTEAELKNMGLSVERLWGSDRYATAVKIAEKLRMSKPSSKVFLTTGEEFQYAMMISPYASKNGIPIVFSEKNFLNSTTADAIKKWRISEVDIIGNTDVVSQSVEDNLKAMGIQVNRVSGFNSTDTNICILYKYKMGKKNIAVARDDIFTDGLTGASFAASKDMHMILIGHASADPIASSYLRNCSIENAYILGGSGAVSDYIITLIRKGNPNSMIFGNTPGNINGGGLAATAGEWIYFNNSNESGKLYKIKTDGERLQEICSDVPMNINVVGDWVYYTNLTDGLKIYKIRSDGTCRTVLNDDASYNTTVVDNWIYYINRSDKGHLYRIAIDGTLKLKLNDTSTRNLIVKWDWIYYINADDNMAYKLKPDNPAKVFQLKNVFLSMMNIENGQIYFSNQQDGNSLYKVNIDGTGLTKLCTGTAYDIQAVGGWIYYSDGSSGDTLNKIMTDGTGKTRIYEGYTCLINVTKNYIYFSHDNEGKAVYRIHTDGTNLVETASSPGGLKDYIHSIRNIQNKTGNPEGGIIEWVEFVQPTDGVPVKDAFNSDGKKIAFLTFDDGPSWTVTPAILDILKEYNIKATFFITGSMAVNKGDLVKRAYSEGHTIANHSYSHKYEYAGVGDFMGEVKACDRVLKSILGDKFETKIFRFPGGSFGNNHSLYKEALKEQGYEYINWNVSTGDSSGHNIPASTLLGNVKQTAYGKDHVVVLMHDLGTKYTTIEALPSIIEYLKSQGYEFRKLIK